MEIISFLWQYSTYLLIMVLIQVILGTAAHWATKERGLDDTWVGAIGLVIVFGIPPIGLLAAGLDTRIPVAMLAQVTTVVSVVKFTEWAKRRAMVDVALFVLLVLACLVPPALIGLWLAWQPITWAGALQSLSFVGVSVVAVGSTAMGWDWHHHTICGYPARKREGLNLRLHQQEMLDDVRYALDRQAKLVQEAISNNIAMDRLAAELKRQQGAIAQDLDQLEKYRRIGVQTLTDLQNGVNSCYISREQQVGQQMAEEERGNEEAPHSGLRVVGR